MTTDLRNVDIQVFLFYDDDWQDISSYVQQRAAIEITRGTANEGNSADPAACTLPLNNRDGRFSTNNPRSPLYGLIGKNTPIWVLATPKTPNDYGLYCPNTGATASTPDAAALDITGDLELQVEFRALDILNTQALIQKGITGTQFSYGLALGSTGQVPHVTMRWSTNGTTTSFVDHDMPDLQYGKRTAIKATLDVSNGGNHVITFYTSDDGTLGGTWTQHGDAHTVTGTTSVFSGTGALTVGKNSNLDWFYGLIYGARVLNGIGGTAVANPDFDTQTIGATSFTDAAGRTWTVAAGADIGYLTHSRFFGEVSAWPQTWDTSGKDVYVPVQAAGVSRRLTQGQQGKVLDPVKVFSLDKTGLWYFWPGDTNQESLHIGPRVTSVGLPGFRYNEGDVGTGTKVMSLPVFAPTRDTNDYLLSGYVDIRTALGVISAKAVGLTFRASSIGIFALLVSGRDSDGDHVFEIQLRNSEDINVILRQNVFDSGITVTTLDNTDALAALADGQTHTLLWTEAANGTSSDWEVVIDGVSVLSGTRANIDVTSLTEIQLVNYDPNSVGASPMSVGYIGAWYQEAQTEYDDYDSAARGHPGETAGTRLDRLCTENDITFYAYGDKTTSTKMGVQSANGLLTLLQECAETDAGFLFDDLQQASLDQTFGLGYVTREHLYNALPVVELDYSAKVFATPPMPPDDDQSLHNDVTVSNAGGGSAEAKLEDGKLSIQAPPDGVNTYATSYNVNVVTDAVLPDHAYWRMRLGTVEEARYPSLAVQLMTPAVFEDTDLVNDMLAVDLTNRARITDLPDWLPPDDTDEIVLGYTESISPFSWLWTANTVPASPYDVAVYADPDDPQDDDARFDSQNSQLAADVTTTDTSMLVATLLHNGEMWTTDSSDFPFDINVGGERMTVTDISGTSSPQTFTVTRSINGVVKAHLPATAVRLWNTPRFAL